MKQITCSLIIYNTFVDNQRKIYMYMIIERNKLVKLFLYKINQNIKIKIF